MDSAYADMIGLPHHVSDHRLPMSRLDRAAQFAPFAALTGFGDVIGECARLTEGEIALSEEEIGALNEKLRGIQDRISEHPEISVLWFQPDGRKSGGAYREVTGRVKKLDEIYKQVVLMDGTRIPMETIYELRQR